ncbi:leucyl aminopeptidase [Cellulomonas carbonis]|uniref:Probable cytosol aminopeptidase n=1 Tax=Cellulomonas carbonis T26 TaxID=947969 RepID=A0A0A0BPH9_9CELL|nr:leucyl aminopeptidase [Cellulomonas carbonis]KGM09860.1 aminopeptidase A [Cellulomonas carbonis T26]GGB92878.1 putative cytosol aminopeptidase [Cellulomonas carbonis]
MATLTLSPKDLTRLTADAVVVGVAPAPDGVRVLDADALPEALRDEVVASARGLGVSGEADTLHRIPTGGRLAAPVLALVGVGDHTGALGAEALRRAAGSAVRQLTGVRTVALALPAGDATELAAVCEGALLGSYAFTRYRKVEQTPAAELVVATPLARDGAAKKAAARAAVVAEAVHGVRDLVNAAPVDLFPAAFADAARTAAKGTRVKVSVLDEKALAAGGYGGILAVGQGSSRPPRVVKLTYSPLRAQRSVALVGKGITFDSGGLSLKPAKGMEAMKSDMAGAAAVLHTVLAAAALELPVRVTGWLCLAENMPSGTAQRPSDVITQKNGTTVEVLNTDAEGRLVLADGLVAACEEKPDVVVDVATLTGAQVVALGTRVSAVMGTDDARDAVVAAARDAGEQFWPMPLPEELRASLKSSVADLANIGDRFGGMLVAGLFLREFVGSTPWAHLDIAGPAFNEGTAHGYTPVGGTGVAVRTLLSMLEQPEPTR